MSLTGFTAKAARKKAPSAAFHRCIFSKEKMALIKNTPAERLFSSPPSIKVARTCANHTQLHVWLKARKPHTRHSHAPLMVSRDVVRQFYTDTPQGKELLRKAGFVRDDGTITAFHVDHIYAIGPRSAGRGLDHVCNYFLLTKEENEFFSDRSDLQHVKLDCVGELARRAAQSLDQYITRCINEGVVIDAANISKFRVVGKAGDKALSKHVFVNAYDPTAAVAAKATPVKDNIQFTRAPLSDRMDRASFCTEKSGDEPLSSFVQTQHRQDAGTAEKPLRIHLYPTQVSLWPERQDDELLGE